MLTNYDILPTDKLPGLHMIGTVTRRFLISYPVKPELLNPFLPPGAEISTQFGYAWVSACFVNIKQMRPSIVPNGLGMEFNYLIHRTRAKLPYPDQKKRESVLVLEPNINRKFFSRVGLVTPGIQFIAQKILLTETQNFWSIVMKNEIGETLYEAEILKASIDHKLPTSSRFPNLAFTDEFLLGVSHGGIWQKNESRLRLLAETHEPWKTFAGTCKTKKNAFLTSLSGQLIEADHVITMTEIPHYFALHGMDVKC